MKGSKATYLILGVEAESDVKYAEPVKCGLYDFLQFSKQVQQTAAKPKAENDGKGHNSGEFLSGFYIGDKLKPVITLVVYFGAKKWDGPRTLHEMIDTDDPDELACIPDYKINLIEPAAMSEDDLDKLKSSLRAVLGCIKYSNDKNALNAFLSKESGLHALEAEAARVINRCTNAKINIGEDTEVVDVCKAIQDMTNTAVQNGQIQLKKDIAFTLHDVNGFTLENIVPVVKESLATVQLWFAERASAANQP